MIDPSTLQAALPNCIAATSLSGLGARTTGKVRDIYHQPGRRLFVATDRLSAFDRNVALIPYKGQVLNQLAAWWFRHTADILPNHVLAVPDPNVTVGREAAPLPVEVVVRGWITGVTDTSLWSMVAAGVPRPYGLDLPAGLRKNDKLPQPVITPTTKGEAGAHDVPLSSADVVARGLVDAALWAEVERAALALYQRGAEVAARAGLLLADTKYELGVIDGRLHVIDELHTPDSSRFWRADSYAERHAHGEEPESLDKEHVRRWLKAQGYGGEGPPPEMPDAVRVELAQRYIGALEQITGKAFVPAELPAEPRLARALATWGAT